MITQCHQPRVFVVLLKPDNDPEGYFNNNDSGSYVFLNTYCMPGICEI